MVLIGIYFALACNFNIYIEIVLKLTKNTRRSSEYYSLCEQSVVFQFHRDTLAI